MHHAPSIAPPRVGVRVGQTLHPAVPVMLGGQEAALLVDPAPLPADRTRVRLDWADGRVTELDARVREVDGSACVAHVDIFGVDGDWRPFLEYLALAEQ